MKPLIATSEFLKLRKLLQGSGHPDHKPLGQELKRARIVDDELLDKKTVRLNSIVEVADLTLNKILKVQIVLPDCVDVKERRISVFAPLAAALLGYREEDQVSWQIAGRNGELKILKVLNT